MKRLMIFIIILLFSFGCSTSNENYFDKDITLEEFNYSEMKEQNYLEIPSSKPSNIEDDKNFNIVNKNYMEINNKDSNCSIFNEVKSNEKSKYYIKHINDGSLLKLEFYEKINDSCEKIKTFENVIALSILTTVYDDSIYVSMILNNEQSGIWRINKKEAEVVIKTETMTSKYKANKKYIFMSEYLEEKSIINIFEKNNIVSKITFPKDSFYIEYYLKDENTIAMIRLSDSNGNEIEYDEDEEYLSDINIIIDEYNINDLIKLKEKSSVINSTIIRNYNEDSIISVISNDTYVYLSNGTKGLVCDKKFDKCIDYKSVDEINGQYILISDSGLSDSVYITKIGEKNATKILSYNNSYISRVEKNEIYISAFKYNDSNISKHKNIKYKITED